MNWAWFYHWLHLKSDSIKPWNYDKLENKTFLIWVYVSLKVSVFDRSCYIALNNTHVPNGSQWFSMGCLTNGLKDSHISTHMTWEPRIILSIRVFSWISMRNEGFERIKWFQLLWIFVSFEFFWPIKQSKKKKTTRRGTVLHRNDCKLFFDFTPIMLTYFQ